MDYFAWLHERKILQRKDQHNSYRAKSFPRAIIGIDWVEEIKIFIEIGIDFKK